MPTIPFFRRVVCALFGCCLAVSAVGAQGTRVEGPDSAATVTVVGVITDALPQDLALGLWKTDATPWSIAVPPDTGRIIWSAIARELRRLLRASDTSAIDTHRSVFRVESVAFHGDSMHIEFYMGGLLKCPDKWMATGTWYEGGARVNWGVRPGSTRPTAFEDSFGCRPRTPPSR